MATDNLHRRVLSSGLVALTLLLGAFACQADAASDSKLHIKGLDRGSLSDADLNSGTSILIFFAGWSPRCRDVVVRANRIQGNWGNKARVSLIDFQESEADIRSFLKGSNPTVPVYLDSDGEFSKRFAVTQLPYLLVVRDGKVLSQGRLPEDADKAIATALK